MKNTVRGLCVPLLALVWLPAQAGDEAVFEALKAQQGKRATVVLTSGTELTGKVASLSQDSVKLAELSGKEFFDAVIDLDHVQAVVYRTREQ